jgi:hypothetical protein
MTKPLTHAREQITGLQNYLQSGDFQQARKEAETHEIDRLINDLDGLITQAERTRSSLANDIRSRLNTTKAA